MAATFAYIKPLNAPDTMKPKPPGDVYTVVVQMTGDASYPTNGYPLGAAQMPSQFTKIEAVDIVGIGVNANTVADAVYNYATGKVQLLGSTGAEIANTTNVAATVITLRVWGV